MMNKVLFILILFSGQIIFCPTEDISYNAVSDVTHTQAKEQEPKSWKEQLADHFTRARNWLKSKTNFKGKETTSTFDNFSEPILMHDTFDESEKQTDMQRVEKEEELIHDQNNESREEELDLREILNNLNTKSTISSEKIQKISPNDFVTLFNSDEGLEYIRNILDSSDFLTKLNEAQVKTIFDYLVEKSSQIFYQKELVKMLSNPKLFAKICDETFDKGLTLMIMVPKINSEVFKDSNVAANILQYPNFLQRLEPVQITALNLQEVSLEVFAKLSVESIKTLLNKPELLAKLSAEQVQAINPETLSKALEGKLTRPLTLYQTESSTEKNGFVSKLSSDQIVKILEDHTGWRLKNWFTFKNNFTSTAREYMLQRLENSGQDLGSRIKRTLQTLRHVFAPTKNV